MFYKTNMTKNIGIVLGFYFDKESYIKVLSNNNYKNIPLNKFLKNVHSVIHALGVCEEIHQVKKIEDNLIEIRATMHIPWAISKRDGILSYITRDGIILPNLKANPFAKEKQYHLIKINSPLNPAPNLGELWEGDDIKNGLNLINLFYAISFIYFLLLFLFVLPETFVVIRAEQPINN